MANLLIGTHERGTWTLDTKTGVLVKDASVDSVERLRDEQERLIRMAARDREQRERGYL